MSAVETVRIKHSDDHGNDTLVINKSEYDPSKHQLAEGQADDANLTMPDRDLAQQENAKRIYEANRGISGGPGIAGDGRNPSGTYSEPTPTDIRYPNKDETEFENNHGAFVAKSAAQMREEKGLPDAPGGLAPEAPHVGKGPRGKFYVKHGTARTAGPFDTEDEAKAALASDDIADGEQSVERAKTRRRRHVEPVAVSEEPVAE